MADKTNETEEPRRWAPSRIASAAILALLVLGGIAYGIYSLTGGSGNNNKSSTSNSQNLTAPKPKTSQAPKTSSTPPATSGSSSTSAANGSSSATSSQGGSLSNTGPGDTALIGFVGATLLGTAVHYGWRKLRQAS